VKKLVGSLDICIDKHSEVDIEMNERKTNTCSFCKEVGHFSRVCPKKDGICCFFLRTGVCKFAENCKLKHPRRISSLVSEASRVCSFYASPRGCKHGDKCPFIHDLSIVERCEKAMEQIPYSNNFI